MNQDLVREMFSLLYRQYNGIGEVSPFKITLSYVLICFYYMTIGLFLLYDYWILSLSLSHLAMGHMYFCQHLFYIVCNSASHFIHLN